MIGAAVPDVRVVLVDDGAFDWLTPFVTLVAVFLGGYISWRVQLVMARRREAGEAKAAARVIRGEIEAAGVRLKDAVNGDHRWYPFYDVALVSWATYNGVLARHLSDDEWSDVEGAAVGLRAMTDGMRIALAPGGPKAGALYVQLSPTQVERLDSLWASVTEAYNALARLVGTHAIDGLIASDDVVASEWTDSTERHTSTSFE